MRHFLCLGLLEAVCAILHVRYDALDSGEAVVDTNITSNFVIEVDV